MMTTEGKTLKQIQSLSPFEIVVTLVKSTTLPFQTLVNCVKVQIEVAAGAAFSFVSC